MHPLAFSVLFQTGKWRHCRVTAAASDIRAEEFFGTSVCGCNSIKHNTFISKFTMIVSKTSTLLNISKQIYESRLHYNCWIAGITKIKRATYERKYPVFLVNPDGSTIHVQYGEPLGTIKLPINLETMSKEEREIYLARRKPKSKIIIEDDIDDDFDESQYLRSAKRE